MTVAGVLITCLWLVFFLFWLISATRAKPGARGAWWREAAFRVILVAAIVLLLRTPFREQLTWHSYHGTTLGYTLAAGFGVVTCALGIAVAIWARLYLGENWGLPMSLRQGHELVTSGPYAYVRHPIYAGIMLALAGTALAVGLFSVVMLAAVCAYFAYAGRVEERSMAEQFPNEYPAYVKRTKMFIPFLL